MKSPRHPLSLIALPMILILCFISIATSGTVEKRLNFPQDCAQDCALKYNKMLENCGDSGGCRGAAVEQYNRCIEACGGKTGGNKGGHVEGNSNKQPE